MQAKVVSGKSEVARVMGQIRLEYQSAMNGLSGFASGASRHDFVHARMERIGQLAETIDELPSDVVWLMIGDITNESVQGGEADV